MNLMAIDPGLTGGVAVFVPPLRMVYRSATMDKGNGNEIDPAWLQTCIINHKIERIAIERQQVASARGAIRNGMNVGAQITTARLCGIEPDIISPNSWQAYLLPKGLTREERKDAAIEIALDNGFRIPTLNPTGKKLHDGCADAACILLYAASEVWFTQL